MRKLFSLTLAFAIMLAIFVGCSTKKGNDEESATPSGGEESEELDTPQTADDLTLVNGDVKLAGSTSMEDLVKLISETMPEVYTGITLQGEFIGSSAGVEQLLAGNCDIGDASRGLKDEEKSNGAVENIVAYDGIAIIKNPSNQVADISKEELIMIYKREITNWSELGGENLDIVVIGRESGSGTRGAFEELLDIEDVCNLAQELDSNGSVVSAVSGTEGAIGYASLNIANENTDKIAKLTLDGVEATGDTIKSSDYLLFRPFVMATKGKLSEQSEAVQAVFEYLASDEGMADIEFLGLITVD